MNELRKTELIAVTGGGVDILPLSPPALGTAYGLEILALLAPSWVPQHLSD